MVLVAAEAACVGEAGPALEHLLLAGDGVVTENNCANLSMGSLRMRRGWFGEVILIQSGAFRTELRGMVHFICTLLFCAGRQGRRVVFAFVATAFTQDDAAAAKAQWRQVADQLRPKATKLATIMDEAEDDVLADMTFPKKRRTNLHSTNPLERLNGEIKRRTNVVGIFPNDAALTRLAGAILLEQNDKWAIHRARYIMLETTPEPGDDTLTMLSATAA